MKRTDKSYVYAALSVLLWSTVGTSFKIGLETFDFIQLIFYATATSVVVLFLILVFQRKVHLLKFQSTSHVLTSMLLGAFNPVLYYLVLFKAYSILPAQLAQPLNMVWPIVLSLLSVPLLGHRIGKWSLAGLFISFIGVVTISLQGGKGGVQNSNLIGILLAVVSSVFWSFYWIFNVRDKRDTVVKLFLNFLFGLVFLTVVVGFFSDFKFPSVEGIYAAIYIGIFEVGITYVLWM